MAGPIRSASAGGGILYVATFDEPEQRQQQRGHGGELTKTGTGELVLSGSTAYNGSTTISAGTLQIGNGNAVNSLPSSSVTDNATLIFNYGSGNLTYGNIISGSGQVVIRTAQTVLSLNAANTYTGNVVVNSGTRR